MDETDVDRLQRELPELNRVVRFARGLKRIPWFANLGEPMTPGGRDIARRYADALGFADAEVALLVDWEDAAAAAENTDWNAASWEAEELLRADLTVCAQALLSPEAFEIAMTVVSENVAEPAREAMEQASFIWDVADEASQTLAVGAAVQAAHQAALAVLAAETPAEHAFSLKFRLFEFGRWPVGIVGGSFNIF